MHRLCLLFALGVIPLHGQLSMDNSAHVAPAKPPDAEDVVASPDTASTAISTHDAVPGTPKIHVQIDQVSVSPGTVREGLSYREGVKTKITLSGPATKTLVCDVVSSDPKSVTCTPITFVEGEQEKEGTLDIKWKFIEHDRQVAIKFYDAAHPETVLRSRLYLHKSLIEAK